MSRLLRTGFFKKRVDGWLSLSGGRLGGNPTRSEKFRPPTTRTAGHSDICRPAMLKTMAAARPLLRELPDQEFSFIYTAGQREMDDSGIPKMSSWAEKLHCRGRDTSGKRPH